MQNERFVREMKAIADEIDMDFVMSEVKNLTDIEYPQTFTSRYASAKYTEALLRKKGFSDVQRIDFNADGKATYQDKRIPISWDVTKAKLTLLTKVAGISDPVIADYEKCPLSLIWGSTSTPEEGIEARIIPEAEVYMGEDARGAIILLEPNGRRDSTVISPLLDLGAIGFISDAVISGEEAPDSIAWINSMVDDSAHWHVQSEDRDFIAFSISTRIGKELRAAAYRGAVYAKIESDAHRHTDGKASLVTATVPGESERELWVMAHLYEPLATDNSSGVIATIAIADLMRKMIADGRLPKPKYTVRLVFAMELYGFAAAADYFGGYLGDRAIGGINIDAMPISRNDKRIRLYVSSDSTPFFANYLILETFKIFEQAFDGELKIANYGHASYGDDCSLNDRSVCLPTVWALHCPEPRLHFHHNSIRDVNFIDVKKYNRLMAALAFLIFKSVAPTEEDSRIMSERALLIANENLSEVASLYESAPDIKERLDYFTDVERRCLLDFKKIIGETAADELAKRLVVPKALQNNEAPLTPWQQYAKGMTARRLTVGMPFDLIKLKKEERRVLPGFLLYSPLSHIISNLTVENNVYRAMRMAFYETDTNATDADYKKYIDCLYYLAEAGYLEIENEKEIGLSDIEKSIRALGIKEGDTVMVHSSLSSCGHIKGGARTVVEAFMKVLGKEGTLMAPAFTRPYLYFEGELQRTRNYRPHRREDYSAIVTGQLPKFMLKECGALRSKNASHSWCAIGKNADAVTRDHGLLDEPTGKNNPMEKALRLGGKVVFFGCGVNPNTFIHYLENKSDSLFLENAIVKYVREDGKLVTDIMRKHLPGCRDFYGKKTPVCKFYTRAIERGLNIERSSLGLGDLWSMKLTELYDIGMKLFEEDPGVTLCDRPECRFCKKYRVNKI